MNEDIKAYIIAQCEKQGMLQKSFEWDSHYLWLEGVNCSCIVIRAKTEKGFYFSMRNDNPDKGLLFHFPIPETLHEFQQVCNLLKIFH